MAEHGFHCASSRRIAFVFARELVFPTVVALCPDQRFWDKAAGDTFAAAVDNAGISHQFQCRTCLVLLRLRAGI